jgi:hypothetical protein
MLEAVEESIRTARRFLEETREDVLLTVTRPVEAAGV